MINGKLISIFMMVSVFVGMETTGMNGVSEYQRIIGGAARYQYPVFLSRLREHFSEYMDKVDEILLRRRAHPLGKIPDYAQPISRCHRKKLVSFLRQLSKRHVTQDKIGRMRSAFDTKRQQYRCGSINVSEITDRPFITDETEFHHIIPLEICGEKMAVYYSQILRGNEPFNVIQFIVEEHRELTDFLNDLFHNK